MTKNEFKQQLIISMAGDTATFWKSDELIARANRVTKSAEKAGITFDGDTRQSTKAPSTKGMQNAVVIGGTVYELVDLENKEQRDCEECALMGECHASDDVICNILFGNELSKNKHFKKL